MGVVSLNTIGSRKHSYGHIGSAVLLGGIPPTAGTVTQLLVSLLDDVRCVLM